MEKGKSIKAWKVSKQIYLSESFHDKGMYGVLIANKAWFSKGLWFLLNQALMLLDDNRNYIWEITLSDLQLTCHLFLHNVENNVSKFWSLEPEPAGAGDIGCRSVTTSVDTCDTVTERGEWQTEWQLQS